MNQIHIFEIALGVFFGATLFSVARFLFDGATRFVVDRLNEKIVRDLNSRRP